MLLPPKIKTIYTIGFLIFFRRFWYKNHAWGSIGSIWIEKFPILLRILYFSNYFLVFGVLSYVVATKSQNHLHHRIPHNFAQILRGKSWMGVNWQQSRSTMTWNFLVFHYFFRFPPLPGEGSFHPPNLRRSFLESHMVRLWNKTLKPFGGEMC